MFDCIVCGGNSGSEKRILESRVEEPGKTEELKQKKLTHRYYDSMILKESNITLEKGLYVTTNDFRDVMWRAGGDARYFLENYRESLGSREQREVVKLRKFSGKAGWTYWEYGGLVDYNGELEPREFVREKQQEVRKILKLAKPEGIDSLIEKNIWLENIVEDYHFEGIKGIDKQEKQLLQKAIPNWRKLNVFDWKEITGIWHYLNITFWTREEIPRHWQKLKEFAKIKPGTIAEEWQAGKIDPEIAAKWVKEYQKRYSV